MTLKQMTDQQLRDELRKYQAKASSELPVNSPSWPHIIATLERIDAEFMRRAVAFK